MPLSYLASWKDYFSSNKTLDSSNNQLIRIKNSVGPLITFQNSFEEISKNPGISFLSLDPSESTLQSFHHGTIIGGSWDSPREQLVSIVGFDVDAKPIQIIQKSIKDIKVKSHSYKEFANSIDNRTSFENLKNPKSEFQYKNILAIPNLLTKTFMNLSNTGPYSVARAFFEEMFHYDSQIQNHSPITSLTEPKLKDDMDNEDKSSSETDEDNTNPTSPI
jgi:hypothetical protein